MITSVRNAKVAGAVKLKKRAYRERERRFLVEGARAVGEALGRPEGLEILFLTDPRHALAERALAVGVETVHVSDEVMGRLTSTVTPQGIVGIAPFVDAGIDVLPNEVACMAILHAVRDPGNAGTVLRSADAAGADAVVFAGESVDVYNPKTVRASAGSLFHLPIVREVDTAAAVNAARDRGCAVYAMAADGNADLRGLDLTGPVAFVFGNEAWGLPGAVAGLADDSVRVPISGGAESLNLAAAATVCLFEWARQMHAQGGPRLDSLIAAAAHDIRSPLTAMKGFGYALATRWDQMTEEQRTLMLQGIVYDADRMNSILKQLVDAARLASDTLELFPDRTDVGQIVRRVGDSLARDPDHPGVVWESGDVVAFVDPDRLQLVIEAFVESLVWWANEGPVRIHAETANGRLTLEAFRADTALTPEKAETLFAPRAPGSGSGSKIGLFIAGGLARAQGGGASVEIENGLRFRLDIEAPDRS